MHTAIVILAAGSSSRLGKAKQLLKFNGKTLIRHVSDEAVAAGLNPCVLVLGSNAGLISGEILDDQVQVIVNKNWESGMSSAIRAGLSEILAADKQMENVILSVCDQPFISKEIFISLLTEKNKTGKSIVACTYAGVIGTPVLFSRSHYQSLLALGEEESARKILKIQHADVATIEFKLGEIDIDTEADYLSLLKF